MNKRSLAEILLDMQLISPEKLKELEQLKLANPEKSLEKHLLDSNLINEIELIKAKGILYQVPWVDLNEVQIDPQLTSLIPEKLARRHILFPLENQEDGLIIAISNPRNVLAIDEIQMFTGKVVYPRLAISSQILEMIEKTYRLDQQISHQMIRQLEEEVSMSEEEVVPMLTETDDGPIIRLVNHIIRQALQRRASDIHIEPVRAETRVRYRIDGVLFVLHKFPRKVHPPLLSRVKIMANLDISQHFVPQDGCISYLFGHKFVDLRISIIPTIYGEKAVLRILNYNSQILSLEEIGFTSEDLARYMALLKHSHGIILITGPTGSGKSTTLSSSINLLASPTINISTVEDPVEYKIDQVNQIQVNEKTGMSFAKALRSLLRQDPDILMIGEIRDEETANIAIRAALTGHLVLSSLHTNDAFSTISRLSNMGVPAYLVASSLIGVVAQRLVRRICPDCRGVSSISADEKQFLLSQSAFLPTQSYIGKGCAKCSYTGYYGRIGIFEILSIDETLRFRIEHNFSVVNLQESVQERGLLRDALSKVEQGLTTVSEVLRVIL